MGPDLYLPAVQPHRVGEAGFRGWQRIHGEKEFEKVGDARSDQEVLRVYPS
jgi:hypothetical protein